MKLNVRGRNVVVSEHMEEYIGKKAKRVERLIPDLGEVRFELKENHVRSDADRFTVQITMTENGQILRAEETTADIFTSIDVATDKLVRQIERHKSRLESKRRKASVNHQQSVTATLVAEEAEVDAEENGGIVRRKQFAMLPITEEEAIEQMELLGHDFFLFYNIETNATNLIYKRRDGDYGLLLPQMA